MTTFVIILVTAASLVGGAALGAWNVLGETARNLLLALAGGALIQASMQELIEPAVDLLPLWQPTVAVLAGAALFSLA